MPLYQPAKYKMDAGCPQIVLVRLIADKLDEVCLFVVGRRQNNDPVQNALTSNRTRAALRSNMFIFSPPLYRLSAAIQSRRLRPLVMFSILKPSSSR